MSHRRRLINVAYRLLGSLADAEDAVQEALIRWYALTPEDREAIESPAAWLTTVTSRICLDQLGLGAGAPGAVRRRVDPRAGARPDRVARRATDDAADPADRITLDESVDMAFLVVLDSMSPAERVAFLLHDVFRYPFAEVAEIVGRTPAACRQLASTARTAGPGRATGRHSDGRAAPRWSASSSRPGRRWTSTPCSASSTPTPSSVADGGGRVAGRTGAARGRRRSSRAS